MAKPKQLKPKTSSYSIGKIRNKIAKKTSSDSINASPEEKIIKLQERILRRDRAIAARDHRISILEITDRRAQRQLREAMGMYEGLKSELEELRLEHKKSLAAIRRLKRRLLSMRGGG